MLVVVQTWLPWRKMRKRFEAQWRRWKSPYMHTKVQSQYGCLARDMEMEYVRYSMCEALSESYLNIEIRGDRLPVGCRM